MPCNGHPHCVALAWSQHGVLCQYHPHRMHKACMQDVEPGNALQPMLANRCNSVEEALRRMKVGRCQVARQGWQAGIYVAVLRS